MSLYTISADYMGGTYLAQVTADNVTEAVLMWAEELEVQNIPKLGAKSKAKLIKDLQWNADAGYGPSPVNGLLNVWCDSFIIRGKHMILDIIKTDEN